MRDRRSGLHLNHHIAAVRISSMPCPACKANDNPELCDVEYETPAPYVCWLFANSTAYREMWGGGPFPDGKHREIQILRGSDAGESTGGCHEVEEGRGRRRVQTDDAKPKTNARRYPSLATQAKTALDAKKEWEAAGWPVRSDEECQRIHLICESCEWFDQKKDRCMKCGCGLSNKASTRWIAQAVGLPDAIR